MTINQNISISFLTSLINAVADPIFVKDENHRFIVVNDAFCNFVGIKYNNLIGKNDYHFFSEKESAFFWATDAEVLATGQTSINTEQLTTPDGKIKILSTKKSRFEDHDKQKYLVGIILDITEIKQLELELKEKNKELKKYINRNLDFEKFTYIASHDLIEPLRSIISFSQLLQRRISDKITDEEKDFLLHIVSSAKHMGAINAGLLRYSHINTNTIKPQYFNVLNLLKQIQHQSQSILKVNNIHVELDLEAPTIFADPNYIAQLLQSLIQNAIIFKKNNTTTKIKIKNCVKNKHWLFTISDNGIGIEKQYFDKIFLIFKRLHNKQDIPGLGMGLSICKKIVEKHNGEIWVESEIAKGSTFSFTIAIPPQQQNNAL